MPVSDLCDEVDLYPTQFYAWLKECFENGHAAFDNRRMSKAVEDAKDHKIEKLEAKLQRMDSVLAEQMEEHVLLKSPGGELTGHWVRQDTRDIVVDFVRSWPAMPWICGLEPTASP